MTKNLPKRFYYIIRDNGVQQGTMLYPLPFVKKTIISTASEKKCTFSIPVIFHYEMMAVITDSMEIVVLHKC